LDIYTPIPSSSDWWLSGHLHANIQGLEFLTDANPFAFNISGSRGLELSQGVTSAPITNSDFSLFFPLPNKWNRIIAANNSYLCFYTGNRGVNSDLPDMQIDLNGNVSIGTYTTLNKLTVAGNLKLDNADLFINVNSDAISATKKNKFSVFISDGIVAEEYALGHSDTWADHVFSDNYKLPTLKDVAHYIKINKHLPDTPSALEVKENGYSQHDITVKFLQKIEELTLYTIERNKKIEQLKEIAQTYESLMGKVNQLESKINQ
jgi:hypothetical protein